MAEKRKGRNPMTGKFEKGNTYAGASKATGIPHPDYPHLDTTGHPLPGFSLNPISAQHAKGLTVPQSVHQLRLELIKCAKPADIKAVYAKLFEKTQTADSDQLDAIKLYLDRFFGKATAEINVQQKTTTTKVNVDLTALSEDELRTYMNLQGKVQSTLALEAKGEDEIVIDGIKGDRGEE